MTYDNRARTTIEQVKENGTWKAFETDAPHDLKGRGETKAEAVANYARLVHECYHEAPQEVASDD